MILFNGKKVEIGKFPDGTILMKESVARNFVTNREAKLTWLYENNEELIGLIYLTRHLQSRGIADIDLHMPYIPNARQDRVKNDEDVFTLKYFSEIINSLNFRSVRVLDPHSSVSEALINQIVIDTPKENIENVISKVEKKGMQLIMFYPDEGAMKRYAGMIDRPYTFGMKKRNWENGEIQGLEVLGRSELIKGSDVLIVDDISSRGGTFYFSAKALKEMGAENIYLYVSHCENTILEGDVLTSGLVTKVFTTNSIFTAQHDLIEVIDYE